MTATSSPACDWPLLDEGVLVQLADDIDEDGALEVVRLFLVEGLRMTGRLEQAFISRGCTLLREVHTLAGASRSVGLLRVGHAATDIEQAMPNGEPTTQRLDALLDLLRQSIALLAAWEATRHVATEKVS